jgi:hypothetical protein
MMRYLKVLLGSLLVLGTAHQARAFSLLGPYDIWQITDFLYDSGTVGGPQNLGEEYRWNVPTLTYAFDESFFNYFGDSGVKSIEAGIKIFNDIPEVSKMSADLSEFPISAKRTNYRAQTLGLSDVKSMVMGLILEEMGVTSSDRFCFCIRNCYHPPAPGIAFPTVIMRSFDPVTLSPSPYVNGTLYSYHIFHQFSPSHICDAIEDLVNPIADNYTAVSSLAIYTGQFYVGLTRDDVGALRYIYRQANRNVEQVNSSVQGLYGASTPWVIPGVGGQTNFTNTALRPGIEKLKFVRVNYDSLLGQVVVSKTNDIFKDYYVLGGQTKSQTLVRTTTIPDFIFNTVDLGVVAGAPGFPVVASRTGPGGGTTGGGTGGGTNATWVNNSTINGITSTGENGPGVIQGGAIISLTKIGPTYVNQYPNFLTQANNVGQGVLWGSFDGSTNEPISYPNANDIYAMEKRVFEIHGVYNPPWYPVLLSGTNSTATNSVVVSQGAGGGGGGGQ